MNRTLFTFLATLAATALLCSSLEAGYVFMKNGYIIQGRVIEKDDERVILQWSDGKMTIETRFIEEIITDAKEDEDIEAVKKLAESVDGDTYVYEEEESDTHIELPSDPSTIITLHGDSYDPLSGGDAVEAYDPEDDTPVATIDLVPDSREYMEEGWGWALTPPKDWRLEQDGSMYRFSAPEDTAKAAITVQVSSTDEVSWHDATRILEETVAQLYPTYTLEPGVEEQVGFERAYRLSGTHDETGNSFSQVLVQHEGQWFLVGLVHDGQGEGVRENLLDSLDSFRFIEREESSTE